MPLPNGSRLTVRAIGEPDFEESGMRAIAASAMFMLLATPALAQMGPGGGGMGGGMGGGQHGHGGMRGGGRGQAGGERPRQMKPVKREALDKPVTAMFRAADRNGDGIVTLEELHAVLDDRRAAHIRARFAQIDTDHNGAISQAEFIAWQQKLGSAASSDEDSAADLTGPVSESIGPDLGDGEKEDALMIVIEPITAMTITNANTNYDAGMSLDELLAYERKRFDDADINHDGELSADELRRLLPRRGRGGPGDRPDGPRPPEGPRGSDPAPQD